MTEADLTRIESVIGEPLPPHYRNFLRDHSETLRAAKTRFPIIAALYYEADDVIREHGYVTGPGMYRTLGDDRVKWPPEFLVIGGSGGDCWFINLDSRRERLWEFKHEGGYILPAEFESWEEYLVLLGDEVGYWENGGPSWGSRPDADPGAAADGGV